MKKDKLFIIITVVFACLCMGLVDAIIQPGYWVKSVIKVALFLLLPIIYGIYSKASRLKSLFIPNKSGLLIALAMGLGIYAIILGAYFVFRNIFDFSALTSSLTDSAGVDKNNFIFVALYISFVNSLLEEFFFRGFAFLTLKNLSSRKTAYLFSSAAFAFYHVAMMIGWFGLPVVLLALAGLFAGGMIFNFFNEKWGNIYLSWLIHMFANFAINTIGFMLFNP